jgi:hypothetical protein
MTGNSRPGAVGCNARLGDRVRLIAAVYQRLLCKPDAEEVRLEDGYAYPGPERIGSIEMVKSAICGGQERSSASAPSTRVTSTIGPAEKSYELQGGRDYHGIHPISSPSSNLISPPAPRLSMSSYSPA